MKKVVIYTHTEWAFGSIHAELAKYLFTRGVDASLLSWETTYSHEEMQEIALLTDVFITNPHGYLTMTSNYDIDPEQIIVVAHAVADLHVIINSRGKDEFDKPRTFAVVSKFLADVADQLGITRAPTLLPLGINTNRFVIKPAQTLKTVGYASAYSRTDQHSHDDIKRGHLAQQAAQIAGLDFKVAANYHHSYVTMPGFYNSVDCVITASTEEGAGLPALEAGAAGRLVISTPVGHWNERVGANGGETVPIDEAEFLAKTTELLKFYKNNPLALQDKCIQIQKHAASYDWSYVIDAWKKVL